LKTLITCLLIFTPLLAFGVVDIDPRKDRPLSDVQAAAIATNVALVQKQMATISHIDFNFSGESVEWLDSFIERNRAKPSTSKIHDVLSAYLGESIRIQYKCSWVVSNDDIALRCPSELLLFPFTKIEKQFANGHEDSIFAFFQAVPQLIKNAKSNSTDSSNNIK